MNFLNSRSNNFLDKGQKAGIIAIALAELCKGSTPDSDSVCEGSNPSSAAIKNVGFVYQTNPAFFAFIEQESLFFSSNLNIFQGAAVRR